MFAQVSNLNKFNVLHCPLITIIINYIHKLLLFILIINQFGLEKSKEYFINTH